MYKRQLFIPKGTVLCVEDPEGRDVYKRQEQLENLSRIYSVEENKTITVSDLIRRGLKEKFQLEDCNDDTQ